MQMDTILVCVVAFVSLHHVAADIQQKFHSVKKGYEVTSFYQALNVNSVSRCATSCNVSTGCYTATFDSQSRQCKLSSQVIWMTNYTGNTDMRTIFSTKDAEICMNPPSIVNNGSFEVNLTVYGSYAVLNCDTNYQIASSSLTIVNCTYGEGWDDHSTMMCVPANTPVEHFGTSFVFAFMKNGLFYDSISMGELTVIVTSLNTSIVTLEVPSLAIKNTANVIGSVTFNIDKSMAVLSFGVVEDKVVMVTSDSPVHVTILNFNAASSDGTTIHPVSSLGQEYYVASYFLVSGNQPEFLIASTENSTLITIKYDTVASENVMMDAHKTYLVTGTALTGTKVSSNKPIFLIAGHMATKIPYESYEYLDFISEMMPPMTSLGTTHIISFMYPRKDFTVGIVATMNNTEITVFDNTGNELETITSLMESSSVFRTYYNSMTISVLSNNPIMVHQYGHGSHGTLGDPSMMFIPDVDHFAPQYLFYVPHYPSILVIVMSNEFSDAFLELNGPLMYFVHQVPVIVSNDRMYSVNYVTVTSGSYRLTHQSPMAVFGAWVYGRNDNTEFAWSLGYV